MTTTQPQQSDVRTLRGYDPDTVMASALSVSTPTKCQARTRLYRNGWAAVIAVPTLITGFYGMNVPYPGFSKTEGFVAAVLIMAVGVSALSINFRKRDWI